MSASTSNVAATSSSASDESKRPKPTMGNTMDSTPQQPQQFTRLKEFSVVYTGAALNLMSQEFQQCMRDISSCLKGCYNAKELALVPGSGTFAMEAIARQFCTGKKTIIVRNGWFSVRWNQILEMAREPEPIVIKAKPAKPNDHLTVWSPPDLGEVIVKIQSEKPAVVIATHVETTTGIILSKEYIQAIGKACRDVDALFVLDCIASGAIWVDMQEHFVDVLISAPQKAWSGPACCGFVLMNERASDMLTKTTSTSFSCDLKQWNTVMQKYEGGAFMYHTTLPTDALLRVRDKMLETKEMGWENARKAQLDLGKKIRQALAERGFMSVAAPNCEAPGVVVVHTPTADMVARFGRAGVQVAAGMKFGLDEPTQTQTFRVGLFGLDKWKDVDGTVKNFKDALTNALESKSIL